MKKIILLLFFISFKTFSQDGSSKLVSKNQGYFNITKLSYIKINNIRQELFIQGEGNIESDLDTDKSHAWSIQTINGYFLSSRFSLGLGIGLDGYHTPTYNTLPVFLDVRAYLSDDADSFYTYLDVGPTIRFGGDSSELKKGMLFNLGLGYKFNVSNNFFLVSDIFYSHKTISVTGEGIRTSDNILKSNGIGLSLGVIF